MVDLGLQVNIIPQVSGRDIHRALKAYARDNFIRSAALSQGALLDRLSAVLRYQLYQKQCKLKKQVPETANKYRHSLCSMIEVFPLSLSFYRRVTDLESETQCFGVCEQLFFEQIIRVCGRRAQPAFWGVSSINLERWGAGSYTGFAHRACLWRPGDRYPVLCVATKPGSRGGCNWCRSFL